MNNLDIRMLVSEKRLKYKDIAKELDISREWLCRLLRNELSPENKIRVMRAIDSLLKGADQSDI